MNKRRKNKVRQYIRARLGLAGMFWGKGMIPYKKLEKRMQKKEEKQNALVE